MLNVAFALDNVRAPIGVIMNRAITALAVLLSAASTAVAQDWPTRSVTLVIPLAAGGGSDHLACALLNATIGVDVTHIPYRGGGPAMQDLIGGRLDYQCALASIAMPQIEAKQAKAIATLSPERSAVVPSVPSLKEQGLPDFDASAWNAIFLPKDPPRPVVQKLHAATGATVEAPAVPDRP